MPALGSNFQFTQSGAGHREVLPGARRRDARRSPARSTLDRRDSAESICTRSPTSRCADTTRCSTPPMPGLGQIELRQPLALDRRITLAVFVDELDYRIRGAYPLLNPYTNRDRRDIRAIGRSTATTEPEYGSTYRSWAAHRPNRLRARRVRYAHELRHRPEFLEARENMNIRSIRYLWRCRSRAGGGCRPGCDRSGSHRRGLRRSSRTGEHAGLRQREPRAGGLQVAARRAVQLRDASGADSDAERQRISMQFQQQYTDKQREIVGPLFQRAQLAIAAGRRTHNLTSSSISGSWSTAAKTSPKTSKRSSELAGDPAAGRFAAALGDRFRRSDGARQRAARSRRPTTR